MEKTFQDYQHMRRAGHRQRRRDHRKREFEKLKNNLSAFIGLMRSILTKNEGK